MPRSEVIRILGEPGDYSTCTTIGGAPSAIWYIDYDVWQSDDGIIVVRFNNDNNVVDSTFFSVINLDRPTLIDKVRRWMGLK
jgi:hypothetical protein